MPNWCSSRGELLRAGVNVSCCILSQATVLLVLSVLGLTLHGCGEPECEPGSACAMRKACHSCCDDDVYEPDAFCANQTTAPAPMGEKENQVCHAWCDKKCPSAVNTTDVGACVTPARHAAEASLSSTFGHVHEDHARSIHLRGVKSNNASCMWRQTGNCDAKGPREAERDQGCEAVIEAGLSGFCECTAKDSSGKKIKSRGWEASCSGRFPFTCQLACLGKQPASLCAWRQTGGCDPSGTREPDNDKRCGSMVPAGASGFCECGIDHRHTYKRTCDGEETFACIEACSSLLFEDAETAAAADSSEAEI